MVACVYTWRGKTDVALRRIVSLRKANKGERGVYDLVIQKTLNWDLAAILERHLSLPKIPTITPRTVLP
jgi:hypothetical protein